MHDVDWSATRSQLRARASRLPNDRQLAIRSWLHWLGRSENFARPRVTLLPLSSLPRASIGVCVCFGAVSCIAGLASARLRTVRFKDRPSGTPLMSFHSLQRLQVMPRCLALPRAVAVPLRRSPSMRFFALRRLLASASDPAAWPRNLTTSVRFAAPPAASHASPPFLFGDVPLPADSGPRDRVGFESPKRRDRDLIFRWGRCLANINSPKSKLRPTIRRGCVVGDSPDSTHGISPFAGLLPMSGGGDVSIVPGLRAVRRLLAAINFRRGIVRPRKSVCEKGRAIKSFRFDFQASTPVIDPCPRDFSRAGRSCLGFCF